MSYLYVTVSIATVEGGVSFSRNYSGVKWRSRFKSSAMKFMKNSTW